MGVHLVTPRMLLRVLVPADVPRLVEFESDPEVMRYLNNGGPPMSEESFAALVQVSNRLAEEGQGLGIWAAISVYTLEFAGWFHLFSPEEGQDPELGYHLARRFWGRGLATEVAGAILAKAEARGMRTCVARAMLANTASTHVMEKLGMRPEREYLETGFPGEDQHAIIYRWHAAHTAPRPSDQEEAEVLYLPFVFDQQRRAA
jgi:RimJ/RimL family protein N-acetyltransferase